MKWKNRLTNYNFWISISSAVLLIFQAFNFEFDIACISEIATAVLGLLVVIGIISDPTKVAKDDATTTNLATQETQSTTQTTIAEEKPTESTAQTTFLNQTENETDNNTFEVDYQAVIEKISKDIFAMAGDKLKVQEQPQTQVENVEAISTEQTSTEIEQSNQETI